MCSDRPRGPGPNGLAIIRLRPREEDGMTPHLWRSAQLPTPFDDLQRKTISETSCCDKGIRMLRFHRHHPLTSSDDAGTERHSDSEGYWKPGQAFHGT